MKYRHYKKFIQYCSCCIILLCLGCKNDIETINALSLSTDLPTTTFTNASFEYSDTAKIQSKLNTPLVKYFLNHEDPHYEFPNGIEVLFYDTDESVKSVITSKYAKYYEEKALFEVRDSVVARDLKENQKIETEQLFWDQEKRLIYSTEFSKITNADGVHFGENGFEAAQDFSYYRLIGSKGKMKVKNDEE